MANINKKEDFEEIVNNISFFSHAYILNTNSLVDTIDLAKILAKKIIFENISDNSDDIIEDIEYKIDNNIFDDMYIVNPQTININNEEIEKLLKYMETKSIREDGRRVYIINGLERISRDISNKILKFLEEPEDNIYAILITSNLEQVLPTIKSRAQVINIKLKIQEDNLDDITKMNEFLDLIIEKKEKSIPYTKEIFGDIITNRELVYHCFEIIEKIVSNSINVLNGLENNENYYNKQVMNINIINLINILDITNYLKQLINKNVNINLLIDRFIISVVKEMNNCENSGRSF